MWKWLTDKLDGVIMDIVTTMFSGVLEFIELLKMTPKSYPNMDGEVSNIWVAIVGGDNSITKTIATAIGLTLLALFFLMELTALLRKQENRGIDAVYNIAVLTLKFALAKVFIENAGLMFEGIFAIGNYLNENIETAITKLLYWTDGTGSHSWKDAIDQQLLLAKDAVSPGVAGAAKDTAGAVVAFIECLLLKLFNSVLDVMCKAIIHLRYVEIFVFCAISAIPLSTLPSEEYGQIGKNFIKRMVAFALHVILINVCIYIYVVLMIQGIDWSAGYAVGMWMLITYKLLLVFAIFQTGGWSKSLLMAQ